MRNRFVHVLGFGALLLACKAQPHAAGAVSQAADAAVSSNRDAEAPSEAGARDSGANTQDASAETTSCDAMRCKHQGDELAKSLMTSETVVTKVQGGDCARVDIGGGLAGLACTCQTSNGWLYIGPKGAGCYARGRAGDCLWDDSEFKPCTQGDPKCAELCEELERRYAADAAKMFDVEVRSSTCRNGVCRHVLRIQDTCFTERSIASGRHFDCNLSDSDILDRENIASKQ